MSLKKYSTGETVLFSGTYECTKTHMTKQFERGQTFTSCPRDNTATNWLLRE